MARLAATLANVAWWAVSVKSGRHLGTIVMPEQLNSGDRGGTSYRPYSHLCSTQYLIQ
jgi:hypothetical protein